MAHRRTYQGIMTVPFKDDYTTTERDYLIQRWNQIPAKDLKNIFLKLFSNGETYIRSVRSQEVKRLLTSIGIKAKEVGTDWRGISVKGPIKSPNGERSLQLKAVRLEFAMFDEVNLRESDMSGAYLRWSQFLLCNLTDSNLSDIRGKRALFERCNLYNVNFSNAKLLGAQFVSSNLEKVQICAAELEQVSFIKTDLRGARFINGVNLQNALFDGITANPEDVERWNATFEGTAVTSGTIGQSTAPEKALRRKIISWHQEQGISTYEPLQCYLHADRRLCPLDPTRSASRLFIGMPFNPSFKEVYEVGIVPAAQAVGLRHWRADEVLSSSQVLCKVCFEIQQCEFALFDITGGNANVTLELGLALGRNSRVILIRNSGDQNTLLITDLRGIEYIEYLSADDLRIKLEDRLRGALATMNRGGIHPADAMELAQALEHKRLGIGRFTED